MAKAVASINLADGAEANSNAKKVATNYLASDSTGIMVAELSGSSETPSTATGNNVRITSTTVDVRKGQNNLTTMGQSGMQIYNGSGTLIANLGYGSTIGEQGQTVNAPYYTLGTRASGSVIGKYSMALGSNNEASEMLAYAEGGNNVASGILSHVEGAENVASGGMSHAEGAYTQATNGNAHAEGISTLASGGSSHSEGGSTKATGYASHAEGYECEANGARSHAQGYGCVVAEDNGTVLGKFNSTTTGYAVVIGGGSSSSSKADILKIDWSGNVTAGNITVGSVTASSSVSVTGNISATGTVTQKKATYDGNATGVSFWNSAITTRTTADLYRIGNTVFCYLRFTSPSTVSSGQAIATIPTGYRPNHTCCFTASIAWENNNNAPITVGTGGAVAFVNTAFTASKSYIVCGTWLTDNSFPT